MARFFWFFVGLTPIVTACSGGEAGESGTDAGADAVVAAEMSGDWLVLREELCGLVLTESEGIVTGDVVTVDASRRYPVDAGTYVSPDLTLSYTDVGALRESIVIEATLTDGVFLEGRRTEDDVGPFPFLAYRTVPGTVDACGGGPPMARDVAGGWLAIGDSGLCGLVLTETEGALSGTVHGDDVDEVNDLESVTLDGTALSIAYTLTTEQGTVDISVMATLDTRGILLTGTLERAGDEPVGAAFARATPDVVRACPNL